MLKVKSVKLWDLWKHTDWRRGQPQWSVQRRLNRTCSFRRWHSSLLLFPRLHEDVTCLSGYCFGRQQSLSQPGFGIYSKKKFFWWSQIVGLLSRSGKDTFTDAGQKCDAPMPCSCANHGLFSNCTPSGHLVSCIRDSTKSDCPQHSRHFGHPKDNLFGAESIPFPTNVKIGSFSQKYLFISVEICTFASAIESQ